MVFAFAPSLHFFLELFLVEKEADVVGYSSTDVESISMIFVNTYWKKEIHNLEDSRCVRLKVDDQTMDWLKPKDKMIVQCQLSVLPERSEAFGMTIVYHGAERLSFTAFDYAVIE